MRIRIILSLLFATSMLFLSTASFAQVSVSIRIAPPPLPVYEQPLCPGDGYIWTPGYWAWNDDYYWVPGTWVIAPEPGFLWTPAYWGWGGNGFIFNEGYWGPSVGFYGGIDYGFGYFGHGYEGGRWENGHFSYNTTLNNVNVNVIHNVYNTRVNRPGDNRTSYNGGNGGINAHATAQEEANGHERHTPPAAPQTQHALAARNDLQQRFSANHGAPPVAATPAPGAFKDRTVVPARQPATAVVHPKELPPIERPASPNTGDPKLDQKYQKQQENLITQQNQDRLKLQQKQDQEHQHLAKQPAGQGRTQQVEQQHQQQTQQLQQKHTKQIQQMQQKQPPSGGGGSRGGGGERR
jgi:hypothetical protein